MKFLIMATLQRFVVKKFHTKCSREVKGATAVPVLYSMYTPKLRTKRKFMKTGDCSASVSPV